MTQFEVDSNVELVGIRDPSTSFSNETILSFLELEEFDHGS